MSFSESSAGLSSAEDRRKSPEEAARIDHEIMVAEEKKFQITFRQLSEAILKVDESRLDETQHPVFLEIQKTLEQAARLAAHA